MSKRNISGVYFGSRTDVGQLREHNEDSLLVKDPLFVIADGMGGHAAGEVASELAVRTLEDANIDCLDSNYLKRAIAQANTVILRGARDGLGKAGMGTTLTAAVIEKDTALIAQVGDSRAYLMQDMVLRQATRDHSLIEELLASGQISEEEARNHPNRSVITRALGLDSNVQADIYELRIHEGDRILLCSDGLNSMLEDDQIEQVLLDNSDPQDAADALVTAANIAGGHDNITVIVINVESVDTLSQVKQKHRFIRNIVAFLLALTLILGAAIGGVYYYADNSAFLIENNEGYVDLYRGLPGSFMGIKLNQLEKTTTIQVSTLSSTVAGELKSGVKTASLKEAEALILEYEKQQKKTR